MSICFFEILLHFVLFLLALFQFFSSIETYSLLDELWANVWTLAKKLKKKKVCPYSTEKTIEGNDEKIRLKQHLISYVGTLT